VRGGDGGTGFWARLGLPSRGEKQGMEATGLRAETPRSTWWLIAGSADCPDPLLVASLPSTASQSNGLT